VILLYNTTCQLSVILELHGLKHEKSRFLDKIPKNAMRQISTGTPMDGP
jgi:hypothetical protein